MIDWHFIGALEGQSLLTGYVPNPEGSQSGVTIATGVDLGQLTIGELTRWTLPETLCDLLEPYVGLRGAAAVAFLDEHPLTITQELSDMLDEADRKPITDALARYYGRACGPVSFMSLPDAAQTVIASVAFQYGPALRLRTPRFWATAVARDWQAMVNELCAFGDAYPTRRRKEAGYLAGALALTLPAG